MNAAELPALIGELMALACAWSGYPPRDRAPAVEVVAPEAMPLTAPAVYLYATPIQGYAVGRDVEPDAILLTPAVDLAAAFGRSVLLHELVHACQAAEGRAAYGTPLWHAREREAYHVQHRYLRASGLALRYPFGLGATE